MRFRFTTWIFLFFLPLSSFASDVEYCTLVVGNLSSTNRELASFPIRDAFSHIQDQIAALAKGEIAPGFYDAIARAKRQAQEIDRTYEELLQLSRTHREHEEAKADPELQKLAAEEQKEIESKIAQL